MQDIDMKSPNQFLFMICKL